MKATLYRENAEMRDADIYWSVVGPGHDRAYFCLIDIAGVSGVRTNEYPGFKPPFKVYSMGGHPVPDILYPDMDTAKLAAREFIVSWLETAPAEVEWTELDTGVHFEARANGIRVANYYYCPKAFGTWHKGFRTWFGGTYYTTALADPEEARSAVAETWKTWMAHARSRLLNQTSVDSAQL
jgi:hypothetical protein